MWIEPIFILVSWKIREKSNINATYFASNSIAELVISMVLKRKSNESFLIEKVKIISVNFDGKIFWNIFYKVVF